MRLVISIQYRRVKQKEAVGRTVVATVGVV